MNKTTKFLIQNVGFHYDDLSLGRQLELEAIKEEMNVSMDWILLALSKDTLEKWEQWGFALFKKPEFKNSITSSLNALKKVKEERIEKELSKTKSGKPKFHYSPQIPKDKWKQLQKQGGKILEDCEAQDLDYFLGYNQCIKPEAKERLKALIDSGKQLEDFTEGEELLFTLGTVGVRWYVAKRG